jgi:hypothetical protein
MPNVIKVSDVLDGVRVLCNDVSGQSYTNDAIFPHFKTAYRELIEFCMENNINVTNTLSQIYPITTAMKDIGGPTGPALPGDLIEIQQLWERTTGTNNDFVPMFKRDFLPKVSVLTNNLVYWSWQQQVIKFLGALTPADVQIDYIGTGLPDLKDENTIIKLLNCQSILEFRTAGLAATYIGENNERGQQLNGDASNALERFLNVTIKSGQIIPTRRMPFRSRYKRLGGW